MEEGWRVRYLKIVIFFKNQHPNTLKLGISWVATIPTRAKHSKPITFSKPKQKIGHGSQLFYLGEHQN